MSYNPVYQERQPYWYAAHFLVIDVNRFFLGKHCRVTKELPVKKTTPRHNWATVKNRDKLAWSWSVVVETGEKASAL